jgi:hypothetical protein
MQSFVGKTNVVTYRQNHFAFGVSGAVCNSYSISVLGVSCGTAKAGATPITGLASGVSMPTSITGNVIPSVLLIAGASIPPILFADGALGV